MSIKRPKCPKCEDDLDYDPTYKVWRCLWRGCNYKIPQKEEEGNPIMLSVFGSKEKI